MIDKKNHWDFLKMGKLKNKEVIDFLRKEISLTSKSGPDEEMLTSIVLNGNSPLRLFHFRLSDANVNSMKRKEGWRLEFYRFNELDEILLSDEARLIFTEHNNEIKALLNV